MTIQEFNGRLNVLARRYEQFMRDDAPLIAGNAAVAAFKENFEQEGFFDERWQQVRRRMRKNADDTADGSRKILTGTGDLGRSIEVREAGDGRATVWTNPEKFADSGKNYARVHNEGLRAGRGAGFTMPRRQFIGQHEKLYSTIIRKLEQSITTINESL